MKHQNRVVGNWCSSYKWKISVYTPATLKSSENYSVDYTVLHLAEEFCPNCSNGHVAANLKTD